MATKIYKLDFPSGKSYIGVERIGRCGSRYKEHQQSATNGGQAVVYNAWRKYGPPIQSILAVVENEDASITEQRAIRVFRTMKPFGYNMTPGGETSPMSVPEIRRNPRFRKRRSKAQRAIRANMTPEQEAEMARKAWVTRRANGTDRGWKGYRPKGLTPWNKGISRPEETRRKISKTLTGRTASVESRKRQSDSRIAYWSTISESDPRRIGVHTGKTFSEETRQRMSSARKKYWKKRRAREAAQKFENRYY